MATDPHTVHLFAGIRPDGEPIIEALPALPGDRPDRFLLLRSPLFVPGLAQGDVVDLDPGRTGQFRIVERSGQLALRVFARTPVATVAESLTPAVELLGGRLELATARALLYAIHVAVGFREIEEVFDKLVPAGAAWSYGNVYDPATGEPLGWWEPILSP